jgi:uncharacterized membrane protein
MKRFLKILVWPVMIAPAIYLWLRWKFIPETVPMHYNLRGEVDRYGSRQELLWLVGVMTAVSIGTYLLLTNTHRFDPKRKFAALNRNTMSTLALEVGLFLAGMNAMMIYYCSHPGLEIKSNLILAAVGILFAFLGNYLHSIKPNYFAGFRLPWTLENADNWKLTHALAGKLWFAGGLLIAIIALASGPAFAMIAMLVIVAVIVIIPAVYSYRLFKKQNGQITS